MKEVRSNPLVSIVVPVYNNESTIEKCLCSLLNQTYKTIEIIVINDGSTDDSVMTINRMRRNNSRIMLFSQVNKGVSAARNVGIEYSHGEYLMFADGDDEVLPEMIEHYVQVAIECNADIVVGGIIFNRQGEITTGYPPNEKYTPDVPIKYLVEGHRGIFGHVPNKMYKRSLLVENKLLFPQNVHVQEDLMFALSAYDVADTVVQIQYAGYIYNMPDEVKDITLVDLLNNRIEIGKVALRHHVDTRPLIPQINHIVFSMFFSYTVFDDIERILNTTEVMDWIDYKCSKKWEERMILFFVCKKQFLLAYQYFKIRKIIRNVVKK